MSAATVAEPVDERCGSYAGYQAHRKRDETACDRCLTALRNYQRTFRRRVGTASNRAQTLAYRTAARRLREAHQAEFTRYYNEELAR